MKKYKGCLKSFWLYNQHSLNSKVFVCVGRYSQFSQFEREAVFDIHLSDSIYGTFAKMNQIDHQAVIKFLEDNSSKEIKEELDAMFRDSAS